MKPSTSRLKKDFIPPPEVLVDEVIQRLRQLGALSVRKMDGIEETVKFPLPKGLKIDAATGLEISVGKQPETGG